MEDGGSELRKEAGDEGGAINGSVKGGGWLVFSDTVATGPVGVGSGTSAAWLILFVCFCDPKHQYTLKQAPHLLF